MSASSRGLCPAGVLLAAGLKLSLLFVGVHAFVVRPSSAQPAVVATAEGQVGEVPADPLDRVRGSRLEPLRGPSSGVLVGGVFVFGGVTPPPPEFGFITDEIHGAPTPVEVDSVTVSFNNTLDLPPGSAIGRNSANTDDVVVFSFTADGTNANTMSVNARSFDGSGIPLSSFSMDNVPTFPDVPFNKTGVVVDNLGRAVVTYIGAGPGNVAQVQAQTIDAVTGLPNGGILPITPEGRADTDVALLDPAGNRLVIPNSDFVSIRGNIVDTTGPTPTVLPEFPISTTPAIFANLNTAVASNPQTGVFTVAWENLSGIAGDPVNVRARRFDANGNPIGGDFRVNTTVDDAQGQPGIAYNQDDLSAIVWAGDSGVAGDDLDVFLQVYDANGNPIGGEIKANTHTAGVQDLPSVRFMPNPDDQGRPQFTVVWRDVGQADGSNPRGTGTSYRCFSIDGLEDPNAAIFADGFESGDTTSWSDSVPP